MTVRLDNKVALVTGATAGIGRGIAKVLAQRGAHVIGMARRAEPAEELTKEIAAEGGTFTFVQGDVTRSADCTAAVAAAVAERGRLDVLVNNAAGILPLGRIEELSDDGWNAVIGPTLNGVFYMSRAALPTMQAQRDGAIITIASINGVHALARTGNYCAAKSAAIHLMRVIAVENIGRGVRANSVIMGGVVTEMATAGMLDLARDRRGPDWSPDPAAGMGPLGVGLMEAEDVGRAVAVLASDDAREINGATIAVDRGWSAGFFTSEMVARGSAQMIPD